MSEIQMINAAIQGLATVVGGVNITLQTLGKQMITAYEARTKELARQTDLFDKLTVGGQGIPMHVLIEPAEIEPTPGDGVAEAVEEAAAQEDEQPPPQEAPPQGEQA